MPGCAGSVNEPLFAGRLMTKTDFKNTAVQAIAAISNCWRLVKWTGMALAVYNYSCHYRCHYIRQNINKRFTICLLQRPLSCLSL